jgi:hypothetical protein
MAVIELSGVIEGAGGTILRMAGAPSAGTDEIQTITIGGTPTAGATSGFYLTFEGLRTALILWSATNATLVANIDAALEALPNIGTGGVTTAVGTMTSGVGTITVTFTGNRAKQAVGTMTVESALTGTSPTIAVTETTPGVTASFRGAPKGAILVNETAGTVFANTGTAGLAPTWTAQV